MVISKNKWNLISYNHIKTKLKKLKALKWKIQIEKINKAKRKINKKLESETRANSLVKMKIHIKRILIREWGKRLKLKKVKMTFKKIWRKKKMGLLKKIFRIKKWKIQMIMKMIIHQTIIVILEKEKNDFIR